MTAISPRNTRPYILYRIQASTILICHCIYYIILWFNVFLFIFIHESSIILSCKLYFQLPLNFQRLRNTCVLFNVASLFPFDTYGLKGGYSIIFASNVFHNSHLIQKCIQNQQLLLILFCIHF